MIHGLQRNSAKRPKLSARRASETPQQGYNTERHTDNAATKTPQHRNTANTPDL